MSFVYRLLILFSMFFCHIFADYNLQGIMSQMKQREWWRKQTTSKYYDNDYKMALLEHAFTWSFVMELPLIVISIIGQNIFLAWLVLVMLIPNTGIHYHADDWKANLKALNLIEDQAIHFVQIIFTWVVAMGAA